MKALVAMQPYFLPYGGYFSLLRSANEIVFLDQDQYVPRRWMNRCLLEFGSGSGWFTLPIDSSQGVRRPLNQIRVDSEGKGFKSATKTFERLRTSPLVSRKSLTDRVQDSSNLAELNISLISEIYEKLFDSPLRYSIQSTMVSFQSPEDFQDRAIAMCKQFDCDTYLNASGGTAIYSNAVFEEAGINLRFMKPYSIEEADNLSVASPRRDLAELKARIVQGVYPF
jgi:hypothetical protein